MEKQNRPIIEDDTKHNVPGAHETHDPDQAAMRREAIGTMASVRSRGATAVKAATSR